MFLNLVGVFLMKCFFFVLLSLLQSFCTLLCITIKWNVRVQKYTQVWNKVEVLFKKPRFIPQNTFAFFVHSLVDCGSLNKCHVWELRVWTPKLTEDLWGLFYLWIFVCLFFSLSFFSRLKCSSSLSLSFSVLQGPLSISLSTYINPILYRIPGTMNWGLMFIFWF